MPRDGFRPLLPRLGPEQRVPLRCVAFVARSTRVRLADQGRGLPPSAAVGGGTRAQDLTGKRCTPPYGGAMRGACRARAAARLARVLWARGQARKKEPSSPDHATRRSNGPHFMPPLTLPDPPIAPTVTCDTHMCARCGRRWGNCPRSSPLGFADIVLRHEGTLRSPWASPERHAERRRTR